MAKQEVYRRLAGIPALGSRVYVGRLPKNVVYPAAKYQLIGETREHASGMDEPEVEATIQVDIFVEWEQGVVLLESVADSVKAAFQRVATPSSTPPVIDVYIDNVRDDYEEETDLLKKTFDFRIWYEE